ncbi:MAG: rhomboid family intramembrane serine protease [Kiritimatiellae bacterium]|nr:rhomboid family intramembrane serine protease [Kiritimatiellia bacterium]
MRRWLWRLRGIIYAAPAAITLAAVCLAVLLMQRATSRVEFAYGYTFGNALVSCFGLTWPLLSRGFFWQPLTYMFLHDGWWHLALNMLTVLLFGSGLEQEIGGRRFWRVFLFGGVVGGIGWLAVTALLPYLPSALSAGRQTLDNSLCIGASGGVFALIGAYAALFPQREVMLLLPFPIRMRARTMAVLLGILTVAEAVFLQSQVAYAAHLGGGLAGYFLGKRL